MMTYLKRSTDRGPWWVSVLGVLMVAAGVGVYLVSHHDHSEWVAIVLIVLGAGMFDRYVVVSILRARFGTGHTTESPAEPPGPGT